MDPVIGTQCEPPESVEPVKESQVNPYPPAPTLRHSARNRKLPTYVCTRNDYTRIVYTRNVYTRNVYMRNVYTRNVYTRNV